MAIIKWAGGKTQLLSELKKDFPVSIGTYVEPFVGSGALFLDINPGKAVINDSNRELINLYECLKKDPDVLKSLLTEYECRYNSFDSFEQKKEYYYFARTEFNKKIVDGQLDVKDAALFVFLNKTCYNGLFRVNKSGTFNVPFGKRKKINLLIEGEFERTISCLENATIMCGDFQNACNNLSKNDFVYFDPPYYDTFDTYQAGGFPESEQRRLANLFEQLTQQGVYCLLSNSDTDFVKKLYSDYNVEILPVKRMINRNGSNRTGTEVIVRNY